jgi:uncharacterized protein (DUF2344 family)
MDIADESPVLLWETQVFQKKRSKIRLNKKKPKFWMENILWIYLRLMNHPVHLWEKTSNSEKSIKFRKNNKKIEFFL